MGIIDGVRHLMSLLEGDVEGPQYSGADEDVLVAQERLTASGQLREELPSHILELQSVSGRDTIPNLRCIIYHISYIIYVQIVYSTLSVPCM
jgi:hypothetical protein